MKSSLIAVVAWATLAGSGLGQIGPDIIVGDLHNLANYTPAGGFHAYSLGTTSCNVGDQNALWIASTNQHPAISQQMYRLKDGVFEQIGNSWLKHGFVALTQSLCDPCNGMGGSVLGVGCSDPYGAGLNGDQSDLGPRYEINAATGFFPYPYAYPPVVTDTTSGRLRVESADVLSQPAGTRFFGEAHYIAADDAAAGNGLNNASWRELGVSASGTISFAAPTVREQPAIMAWKAFEPQVDIRSYDVPADGRFYVGYNRIPIGGGSYRHVFAMHNLNSDQAAGSFSVAMPSGATVQNIEFRDTDYHSGDVWQSTDWAGAFSGGSVTWATPVPFATNVNGPALRWASCHTFIFESSDNPGIVTVGLFKSPATTFQLGPFTFVEPDWQVNQAAASMDPDGLTNNAFAGPIKKTLNFGGSMTVNYSSNVTSAGSTHDIFFQPGNGVTPSTGGLRLPDGQIVNLNLSVPYTQLFNWAPTPSTPQSFVVPAGNTPIELVAQYAVTDAAAPFGVHISAASEVDIMACAAVTIPHILDDDNAIEVFLGPGGDHDCVSSISYMGTSYNSFFINSNGSVSFVQGTGDFTPSNTEFRNLMPRIAGHWSDLEPNAAGTVMSTSTATGDLVVSFVGVQEWGTPGVTTSFDIAFDANGDIRIDNYGAPATWGTSSLVGFSPGGGATGTSQAWSAVVGTTVTVPTGGARYQLVSGSAPQGFTSLVLHPNNTITVN